MIGALDGDGVGSSEGELVVGKSVGASVVGNSVGASVVGDSVGDLNSKNLFRLPISTIVSELVLLLRL